MGWRGVDCSEDPNEESVGENVELWFRDSKIKNAY